MPDETLKVTGLTPADIPAPEPAPEAAPPQGEAQQAGDSATPEAAAPAAEPATAQAPAASPEDGSEVVGEAPQPPKPSRGVQKALDRLTARATQAEAAAARNAEIATQALAALNQAKPAAQPAAETEKAPDPSQFKTWEEFNRETARYEGRQEAKRLTQSILGDFVSNIVRTAETQKAAQDQQQVRSRIAQAYAEGPTRFADWDDVVTASDMPVPPLLQQAIARSADPAAMAHYLGTNPEVHRKLVSADPMDALRAFGMIEASLKAPVAVKSKAPPPAHPVGGRASSSPNVYRDDFTPAQHKVWLERQAKG